MLRKKRYVTLEWPLFHGLATSIYILQFTLNSVLVEILKLLSDFESFRNGSLLTI